MSSRFRPRGSGILNLLCGATAIALVGCSDDDSEAPETAAERQAPAPAAETSPSPAQDTSRETPAAPAPTAAAPDASAAADDQPAAVATKDSNGASTKGRPPFTEPGEEARSIGELHEAYYHWADETIRFTAYPSTATSRARWGSRMSFGAVPEKDSSALASCEFTTHPDGRVRFDTPLVIEGTFKTRQFAVPDGEPPKLRFEDCVVIASDEPLPETGDPWDLNGEPLALEDLHQAAFSLTGQPIRVSGRFGGSTHSSANDITSHGLKAGDLSIGCNQQGKTSAPEAVVAQREGTVVEGTIGKVEWGPIQLDDCQIVTE